MRTIDWTGSKVRIVDQTALPIQEVWLDLSTVDELVEAIGRLAVRGPALGVAGATVDLDTASGADVPIGGPVIRPRCSASVRPASPRTTPTPPTPPSTSRRTTW